MAELVSQDIGACKITGTTKLGQFLVEAEVDIRRRVAWTIEGADCAGLRAASTLHGVGENHQLGVLIASPLIGKELGEGLLLIVEEEGYELVKLLLFGGARCRWPRTLRER